jgi:ABC-type dipeptide/oligopeptide/nickel transport system permease subunit
MVSRTVASLPLLDFSRDPRIICGHVLPSVLSPVIMAASLMTATASVAENYLLCR